MNNTFDHFFFRTISSVGQSARLISERFTGSSPVWSSFLFSSFSFFFQQNLFNIGTIQRIKKRKKKHEKGIQLSWQSTAFARQGPRVRIPLFPPFSFFSDFLLKKFFPRGTVQRKREVIEKVPWCRNAKAMAKAMAKANAKTEFVSSVELRFHDFFFLLLRKEKAYVRSKKGRLTVETQALRDDEGRRYRRYASGSW